jgi:hypothetical protein
MPCGACFSFSTPARPNLDASHRLVNVLFSVSVSANGWRPDRGEVDVAAILDKSRWMVRRSLKLLNALGGNA